MKRRSISLFATVTLVLALGACGDSTSPGDTAGMTTVSFRASTAGASGSTAPGAVAPSHADDADAATLGVDGSNGRLTLASVHLVVSEFELERADEAEDCDEAGAEEACEEFEADPRFLELPLDGEDTVAVRQAVPAGSYDELEFEVEDLELEDDGDDEAGTIEAVLAEIEEQFPDWPREASLRLHGTFTPKDDAGELQPDQARDFTVFFQAEVEIEKEFASPLEVTESSGEVTVVVDPRLWFERGDGTVVDLSRLDFDPEAGGPIPELEVEIEHEVGEGFTEIEIERGD